MAEVARYQYGSVLPGATEPDMFYETFADAAADCAMGPCRIVRRVLGPWIPVGQSMPTPPTATPDQAGTSAEEKG